MKLGSPRLQAEILTRILIASGVQEHSPLAVAVENLMKPDRETLTEQDLHDVYVLLEEAGAGKELLGAVGSWGDTLSPEEVFEIVHLCSPRT